MVASRQIENPFYRGFDELAQVIGEIAFPIFFHVVELAAKRVGAGLL